MEATKNSENRMNEIDNNEEQLECASVSETKSESSTEKLDHLPENEPHRIEDESVDGVNNVSSSDLKPKKREHSIKLESQPEEGSCKLIKLNCDNSSNGCDTDSSASELKIAVGVSNDDSSNERVSEEASSSKSDVQPILENTNENQRENADPSSGDLQSENDQKSTKSEKLFESTSSSASTSSKSSEDENHSVPSALENEENAEFSDDSTPLDTSSCGSSSSSSDFTSMFSPFEDDEDDLLFNEGSASSCDEQNFEMTEDKLPPVLKKTLPADKFSFPKEIMLRQINSGDSRRRRFSKFDDKVYGSRKMVQRLGLYKTLRKHTGCVNTLSFNDTGNILISGSDDRHVCLWDWARNKSVSHFHSGHTANVFQAKFLPYSGDTQLITCGQDKQIRMCLLDESGLKRTSLITRHDRAVHKISMQPQMPHSFLSAGEDGVVHSIDIREDNTHCKKLLKVHKQIGDTHATVSLYSIQCNPIKNYEFIVCGTCDKIRLYDQRNISKKRQNPVKEYQVGQDLASENESSSYVKSATVTCAVYNYNGTEIVASYNDYDIYLFNVDEPSRYAFRYDGHRNFTTIKGVNFFGPRSEYVVSGSDCGNIYIWDKKSESIVQWLRGDKDVVNCLEPHPSFPVLATSGLESDVKIWMPTAEGNENIAAKKDFQKIVKKNLNDRLSSAREDLGVRVFYFMASARRA